MPASPLPSYAVVSPVLNEAEYLARTADSMVAQTHRPLRWVIVDDGSSDDTRAIAERYASSYPWITVIDSGAQRTRARGGKIVRAFNRGMETLPRRPDVVVKMDGDILLAAHYFAWVMRTFARVPRAGIVGGRSYTFDGQRWSSNDARHNVNGVAKAYRMDCLEDIGGLRVSMGWDGIDEYGARAHGWQVHVLSELPILHYRQRGARQQWRKARWEEGVGAHYMGYRADFMAVRIAYRMLAERPHVLAGAAFAAGYLYAHLARVPAVDDAGARAELRAEQGRRLRQMLSLRGRHLRVPSLVDGGPAFWEGTSADLAAPQAQEVLPAPLALGAEAAIADVLGAEPAGAPADTVGAVSSL
jgi:biofilm PGA synthesis N-glycosyltransferase PgaC